MTQSSPKSQVQNTPEQVMLQIKPSRLSEKNPGAMEQVYASMHGIHRGLSLYKRLTGHDQPHFSLEMVFSHGQIYFLARVEKRHASLLQSQFYAHYPDCEIIQIQDYTPFLPQHVAWTELEFTSADLWPIKRYNQFEDKTLKTLNSPLSGVLSTMSNLGQGQQAVIQISISPLDAQKFRKRGTQCLRILRNGVYQDNSTEEKFSKTFMTLDTKKRLLSSPVLAYYALKRLKPSVAGGKSMPDRDPEMEMNRSHDRENEITAASDKISRLPFKTAIRIACFSKKPEHTVLSSKIEEICGAFKQYNTPQLNGFDFKGVKQNNREKLMSAIKSAEIKNQMIMSGEELASIYHLPNRAMNVANMSATECRKMEPPHNLPKKDREKELTLIGKSNFRNNRNIFGIKEDDRRRHMYIVGKTGMGKSTLLENMIFSDIEKGKGVAVIDPHGDLAEAVMDFVPKSRTNDVVLFDPGDVDFPIAFNMLECKNPLQRHLVASGVLGVFKKMFAESWGPRLEHILRNTLMALIEVGGTSLLGVMRMLGEKRYREEILRKVTDPMVLSFWETEFNKWQPKQVAEAVSPIQNKVGQFLSSSLIRNILGQTKSTIDLRFAMDKGKIIIVNLSKGKIGEDNSALLGSMLITKFQLDVMSRADTPEKPPIRLPQFSPKLENIASTLPWRTSIWHRWKKRFATRFLVTLEQWRAFRLVLMMPKRSATSLAAKRLSPRQILAHCQNIRPIYG